jgi:CRISPR-associated protein Cas6
MNIVELCFPVLGTTIATDHGYDLYAALSRLVPSLHEPNAPFNIGPITGDPVGRDSLRLNRRSRLRCRLPAEAIPTLLPLAGKALDLDGHRVRLGVPSIRPLTPAENLAARLVTIRVQSVKQPTPEQFLNAVRWRLAKHGFSGEPTLLLVRSGPRAGQPCRRILRIKGRKLVGYSVQITGLPAEDSLRLQAESPFGRRRMGCGFFVPMKSEVLS